MGLRLRVVSHYVRSPEALPRRLAAFGVGWPSEGSFDLQTAFRVRSVVYGNPGYPDQAPYIDVWIDIVFDAPKYLKNCQSKSDSPVADSLPVPASHTVLLTEPRSTPTPQKPLEPILQSPPEDPEILNPHPYCSPGNPFRPPDSREAAPLQSLPHTQTGAVYYPPQDPDPIPDSSQPAAVLAPLRQIAPPGGDTQTSFIVYVPFSTSDLRNWKLQTPSFSEKPQGLTSLLESIFFTQQLLEVLFTTEKECILREAARGVSDPTGQPTTDPTWVQLVFPSTRPDWNPNTDQATLLPDDDPQQPSHDCLELLDNITCLRPDLTDVLWPQPDATLYTDGSSFVAEGVSPYRHYT
ncbi:RE1-silencing transcription factor-like [Pteropus medius]|uniref:RE1-silencing transcription factor-like n=1 Tax=Pteropus vampyrus TaxID=132908 RepID=UPI00196B8533|nr:RE1-silencing transcription factor-like [Pteropus giganteus]